MLAEHRIDSNGLNVHLNTSFAKVQACNVFLRRLVCYGWLPVDVVVVQAGPAHLQTMNYTFQTQAISKTSLPIKIPCQYDTMPTQIKIPDVLPSPCDE